MSKRKGWITPEEQAVRDSESAAREAARVAVIFRNMRTYYITVNGADYSTQAQATWDTSGLSDGWYRYDNLRATFARLVDSGQIERIDIDTLRTVSGDYLYRIA